MNPSLLVFRTLTLCGLLVLTGCGSVLVDLNLPGAVGPSETFNVAITHTYNDDDGGFNSGGDSAGLIFSVIVPADWTPSATGTYDGNWGGSNFSAAATLLTSPPQSDLPALIAAADPPPPAEFVAAATALDCELAPPVPPAGSKVAWYQVGPPTPDQTISAGDGGTLNLQLTSGQQGGSFTISAQHGVVATNPSDPAETVCVFYGNFFSPVPDPMVPQRLTRVVNQLGGTATSPVPVLGGGMLALLAVLIMLVGVRVGRKR